MFLKRVHKKRCTASAEGTIKSLYRRGIDFPQVAVVEYEVDSITYTIRESVKLKSQAIKAGNVPVGQNKTPVAQNMSEGCRINVMYNPQDPSEAYLPDNAGIMNI